MISLDISAQATAAAHGWRRCQQHAAASL
jgi:hypothetical protein